MIIQINDLHTTTQYRLEDFGKDIITFGRNTDQDIVIKDINTSRSHGYFQRRQGKWYVCDNNSTNGIIINGNIMSSNILNTGDNVILSIRNQDKAVKINVINDEYDYEPDRVDAPRSTNRYFKMTGEETEILAPNNYSYEDQGSGYNYNNNQTYFDYSQQPYQQQYYEQGFQDADYQGRINDTQSDKKKGHKIGLILGISLPVLAIVILSIIFIPKLLKGKNSMSDTTEDVFVETTTEERTTETTTEELVEEIEFEKPYLIDYMILAREYEAEDISYYDNATDLEPEPYAPTEVIDGFEIYDIDNDGIDELLVTSVLIISKSEGRREIIYTYDSMEESFCKWRDVSAAGSSYVMIDEANNIAFLEKDYNTVGISYDGYNIWTKEGWIEYAQISRQDGEVISSSWAGNDISETDWDTNIENLSTRSINDDIKKLQYIESDAKPETAAYTIYDYYINDRKMNAYLMANENHEEYYIVISDYHSNVWKNQTNLEYDYTGLTMADWYGYDSIIIAISQHNDGCRVVTFDLDRENVTNATYNDGIVITDNGIDYLYNISDELEYVKKLTLDDVESKLLSSKWYTIQSGISQSIMEYIFYENGDAICIDYEYEDEKWTEKYRYNYTYTYDSSDKSVSIDFGMDGLEYYYDGSYDAFIMDLTYFNYEYDANYYDRCLVPYDSFPDFDDLSNNCHYILNGKFEDINIDDDSNSNGNQNDAPSSVLTQDQAYNAVVNYCCVQNPELLNDTSGVQDYTYYWTIGELEGEYYTVDYRSYTAAHVYYHVNIYTGDVYTTEFVPGITDGEVAGNESFNAWSYVD